MRKDCGRSLHSPEKRVRLMAAHVPRNVRGRHHLVSLSRSAGRVLAAAMIAKLEQAGGVEPAVDRFCKPAPYHLAMPALR